MPTDDRLRDGLRRLADEIHPDVDAALERVASSRPVAGWQRGIRIMGLAAAAFVAVVAIPLGLALLRSEAQPGSSPSPSPTTATSCPRPDGGACVGALTAGKHRSTRFIPPIDWSSPDGWDNPEDLPGTFTLHPAGPETDAVFFFRDVAVLKQTCTYSLDGSVGHRSADIANWMASNPNLVVTNWKRASVGGLVGVQLDLAASGAYVTVCPGNDTQTYDSGTPIVPLFGGAGSGNLAWFIGGDERMRLFLLDLPGGGNVTISVDAIRTDFQALLDRTAPVIDSVVFDPDYY